MYGLKHAGRVWNHRIHATLEGLGHQGIHATLEGLGHQCTKPDASSETCSIGTCSMLLLRRTTNQPTPACRSRYLQDVGSLMYAMLGTRPGLCYAVAVLGRHAARLDNSHWAAVNRVLAYLKGTLHVGLELQPDDLPLAGFEAYSDSDWGACPSTSRSTMGYTFVLASGADSWLSKLQLRVTASSTEAEYLGLSHASKEAIHPSQL